MKGEELEQMMMRWKMKMMKIKKMIKYDEEMNGENAQNAPEVVVQENLTG